MPPLRQANNILSEDLTWLACKNFRIVNLTRQVNLVGAYQTSRRPNIYPHPNLDPEQR